MVCVASAVDLKIHEVVDTPNWILWSGFFFHERKKKCIKARMLVPSLWEALQAWIHMTRSREEVRRHYRPANGGQNEAKSGLLVLKRGVVCSLHRMTEREFELFLPSPSFHVIVDFGDGSRSRAGW
jgi:hypothetical protein